MSHEQIIDTAHGPARVVAHLASQPRADVVLSHGAGRGIDGADAGRARLHRLAHHGARRCGAADEDGEQREDADGVKRSHGPPIFAGGRAPRQWRAQDRGWEARLINREVRGGARTAVEKADATAAAHPLPASLPGPVPGDVGTLARRAVADVAFNADPASGQYVAVLAQGSSTMSWMSVGGTSLSTPQWAGLVAVANAQRALAARVAASELERSTVLRMRSNSRRRSARSVALR